LELLLERKADPSLQDSKKETPKQLAEKLNKEDGSWSEIILLL